MTKSNNNQTTETQRWNFAEHHPGPFNYSHGSDGVDATFDIRCSTTNEYLVSVHYWDDRENAQMIAKAIVAALNAQLGDRVTPADKFRANLFPTLEMPSLDAETFDKIVNWLQLGNRVGFDTRLADELISQIAETS